jgi:DNA repair protein SbcC/Rad50
MVPLRLHLYNFLSYGDASEPIEFDGVHVACLCGPNGHGKSALLDGITWALWGQARSNSADDLVRLGQSNMMVEFEFRLDGQCYRVIRKRSRGRTGQSDLQFQAKQADGEWRALTGQGMRGTQERINQVLRMDYDTFINSAFILQGRADEFARKTADKRKQILSEILSLGLYEELSEVARARRREAEIEGNALEVEVARMEREHARLPELEAQVERLTCEHQERRLAAAEARARHQEIMVEKQRLDARRRERDDLARRLAGAEAELEVQRGLRATSERLAENSRSLVARAAEIRRQAQEYEALCAEERQVTLNLKESGRLEREREQHERTLREEEYALQTKLQLTQQRVRELNALAAQLPHVEQELTELEGQAVTLDRLQAEREGLQSRLQELAAGRAEALSEQRRCAEELERSSERFELLKGARAICPLCEGELPEEKRKQLGWKLREEQKTLKEAQGGAIRREADARREETEIRRRLQELEAKLKTGQAMRDRLAQARQKHLQIEEANKELPRELEIAQSLETRLQARDFALETRQALANLADRIKTLNYDEEYHHRLTARIVELRSVAERDLHRLEEAESKLPGQLAQVETLSAGIRAREEAMADDRAARSEADRELARAPAVEAEATRLEGEVREVAQAEQRASEKLGAAREAVEQCRGLATQIVERKKERAAATKDQAAYEELARAFGRNGIQALIIENALPEIEEEANTLLGRMSEGQLAVRLKSQRELRTGAQAETLEIEISDEMGARPYELYSGGEAFRVNFALRIALSKLLARRAGARLETLVIDEGFGSQDQEGRQRLVEAIHAIQEDFARILVITHLDELKDAFPTRLEVTKGVTGSQVAVY